MFQNLSVINFLIYSVGLGFSAAIIITNIQRGALSRYINALIDRNCFSEESASTLNQLGLKGINASIAKSATKKQYGLKKSIVVINDNNDMRDRLECTFEDNSSEKYYISQDCDIELLKKRYDYKQLSSKLMILLIAALAAVVLVASLLTELIIKNITSPKIEKTENMETVNEESVENDSNANQSENFGFDTDTEYDKNEIDIQQNDMDNTVSTPRMPVS